MAQPQHLEDLIRRLRAVLIQEEDVRSAWLFGSVARGQDRTDSDVDVAVWMRARPDFERFSALQLRLEQAVHRPVDLVVLNDGNPLVAQEAVRGIPLLTRDAYAELEFVLDVDRQAEDFRLFLDSFWKERRRAAKEARR
ncbi:nucleotidyltransferase domain-containing protein [Thermaerobacter sp. PB12/4term]|uniref:type VII toxin-antitoxin system MntA family adenylyltransferase antitoxin n=1 Tax=Thermaerobacter sp. PB12/4term TaxID=2293838 RepID=UPI000E32CF6E|nr:nucleotidyltransferase domain-containing protein [Thermaerobacter sp. PB12/4term]QIA26674.1 nucleotidyltransferase domain-containing protein [Thermaerobacter sp. PB12/4term]